MQTIQETITWENFSADVYTTTPRIQLAQLFRNGRNIGTATRRAGAQRWFIWLDGQGIVANEAGETRWFPGIPEVLQALEDIF